MPSEKNFPEQERTIGALLRIPWQVLAERVYDALAENGFPDVRPAHGPIFRYVSPQGSRIVDLAERAGITKQSMATLVEYLEERGYITIEPDRRDGRAKRVRLTKKGKAVQSANLKMSRQVEAEWAALIGTREMHDLRRLLERLYDKLQPPA